MYSVNSKLFAKFLKCTLPGVILFLLLQVEVHSQANQLNDHSENGLSIYPELGFNENRLNNATYLDSRIFFRYALNRWDIQSNINFNQAETFELINPRLRVLLPGNIIIGNPTLRAHPSLFTISSPFGISSKFNKNKWDFGLSITLLEEETVIDTPELIVEGGNNLINWEQKKLARTQFLGSASVSYRFTPLKAEIGFSGLPLVTSGRLDSTLNFSTNPAPFLRLSTSRPAFDLALTTRTRDIKTTLARNLNFLSADLPPYSKLQLTFQKGTGNYQFSRFVSTLQLPFLLNSKLRLTYGRTWGDKNEFNNLSFENWKESLTWHHSDRVTDFIPHQSIRAGIQVPLVNEEKSLLKIDETIIQENHIFSSKREFYTSNPVAYVDIIFTGTESPNFIISASSSDGTAFYKSEIYHLVPNKKEQLPIYLYMPFTPKSDIVRNIQLQITGNLNGKKIEMGSIPLTILGANDWTGNIDDLIYFSNENEEEIKARARNLYITANDRNGSGKSTLTQTTFNELKHFLDILGRGITYMGDPIDSYLVDEVQYPLETIETMTGDCEDLVVYLMSHLRAAGYNTSVVDLRPELLSNSATGTVKQINLGHLFLLINTNIPAEMTNKLNLSEFTYVIRKNRFGNYTIWIPYETTVMGKGFEEAWKKGSQQYYNFIIRNEEQSNESTKVEIHDF